MCVDQDNGRDEHANGHGTSANTSPVSPALLGFRTSDPAVVPRVGPVSHALVGFRPLTPCAKHVAPVEVSHSGSAREREHPAESFARKLGDVPTAEDICQLLDLLPGEKPARSGPGVKDAREKSWTAGAYCHGSMAGLRRNTLAFPNATRAVLKHILPRLKAKFGQVTFGALGFSATSKHLCVLMCAMKRVNPITYHHCAPFRRVRFGLSGQEVRINWYMVMRL